MTVVISVVNQKGGVGKTTSSVNLSSAMAEMGLKVLLLDFDPQGHSTEHFGLNGRFSPDKTTLELLEDTANIDDILTDTYLDNVKICPSNLRLGKFNQNTPEGRQFKLKMALNNLNEGQFDIVIIDCQPSLSLLTLNALSASDYVLLPVQSEFLALDGLSQLVVTIKEVRTKLNPNLSILGVILTMYDPRNKLSKEIKDELEKNFGDDLFQAVIPRSVRFAEAPSFGQDILKYAPRSKAARSYTALAEEIMQKLYEIDSVEA